MRQLTSSAEDLLNEYEIRWDDSKAAGDVSHVASAKRMFEKQSHKVDKENNQLHNMDDSIDAIDMELYLFKAATPISQILVMIMVMARMMMIIQFQIDLIQERGYMKKDSSI
jgi:hypothetical protein